MLLILTCVKNFIWLILSVKVFEKGLDLSPKKLSIGERILEKVLSSKNPKVEYLRDYFSFEERKLYSQSEIFRNNLLLVSTKFEANSDFLQAHFYDV